MSQGGQGPRKVKRSRSRGRPRRRREERQEDDSPIREESVEPSEESLRLREAAVRGDRQPKGVEPRLIARADHSVSRKLISGATLKVLYRLKKSGFKAYLCGGAVRDLMLGRRPKDFDVATDATPREVKRLFRNGRIIGRRFRLVHVIFEDEIIEVSTFRAPPDPKYQRSAPDENLITDDNTWGTPRDDAFRRDFTINALFYSIADFSVIDYCGGVDDMGRNLVRVIGDPDLRFQEDPVRMVRACEFAGRLGFEIEEETRDGIRRNAGEMKKAAPPRMAEELLQLLRCGHAAKAMQWMLDLDLLDVVLPEALAMIKADRQGAGGFTNILPTLDRFAEHGSRSAGSGAAGRGHAAQGAAASLRVRDEEEASDADQEFPAVGGDDAREFSAALHRAEDQVADAPTRLRRLPPHVRYRMDAGPAQPLRVEELFRRRAAALRDPRPGHRRGARGAGALADRPTPAQAPAPASRRAQARAASAQGWQAGSQVTPIRCARIREPYSGARITTRVPIHRSHPTLKKPLKKGREWAGS